MNGHILVVIVAIICLTIINVTALVHGIDSTLTGTICAIIGGIAGFKARNIRYRRRWYR